MIPRWDSSAASIKITESSGNDFSRIIAPGPARLLLRLHNTQTLPVLLCAGKWLPFLPHLPTWPSGFGLHLSQSHVAHEAYIWSLLTKSPGLEVGRSHLHRIQWSGTGDLDSSISQTDGCFIPEFIISLGLPTEQTKYQCQHKSGHSKWQLEFISVT